jgi:serine/threonine protein kinase
MRITNKADVWQIGQIMWSILSHTTNDHKGPVLDAGNRAVSAGPFDPKDLLNGRFHPVVNKYSERLKDTVRSCLTYDPNGRPTLTALRKTTANALKKGEREDPRLHRPDPFGEFGLNKRFKS